jgi:hypothetical protein
MLREVDISYQNLPGTWADMQSEWDYMRFPQLDTTWGTSGSGLTGNFSFTFDTSWFHRTGDTISAMSLDDDDIEWSFSAIADQEQGILRSLHMERIPNTPDGIGVREWVTCLNVAYTMDTNSTTIIKLSGPAVQAGLISLLWSSYDQSGVHSVGSSRDEYQTYIDSVRTEATVTIRFTP